MILDADGNDARAEKRIIKPEPLFTPGSGAIALSGNINNQFGLGNNLGAYRGATYYQSNNATGTFASTNLNMGSFYSKQGSNPMSINYNGPLVQSAFTGSAISTQTLTGVNIGTAASNRWVVAICGTTPGVIQSSVTINGVSATVLSTGSSFNSTGYRFYWWIANVTSGTSVNVVINAASAITGSYWITETYSVYNLQSSSVFNSAQSITGSSSPRTININVPALGVLLAALASNNSGTTITNCTSTSGRSLSGANADYLTTGYVAEIIGGNSSYGIAGAAATSGPQNIEGFSLN